MDYIIPTFSLLAVDSIYLSTVGGYMFGNMVNKIQNDKMRINLYGAVGSYILISLVLYKFIIYEKRSPTDAFILGFCVYGIFDFTNYALFTNYNLITGLVDTVWGGLLFYIVTLITYKALGIRY